MSKLVIDMMGGDRGVTATKEGVRLYQQAHPETELILVGKKEELADMPSFKIIDARDVVPMEAGVMEVLRLRESSLVKAVDSVLSEGAAGVVSTGSTGAFLSASTLKLKKIPGVLRPALITDFPTKTLGKKVTILDVGASSENTSEELVQFALMGSLYSEAANGIVSPQVYLLSNGSEEGKGSPEGKGAYDLLKGTNRFAFKGNIEAREVMSGEADVVVTDGYSGNVLLKGVEGTAKVMSGLLKDAFSRNLSGKLGYLLARKGLKRMKETMDYKNTGGALLIGVNAVVVKAHGNSDGVAFMNAIKVADKLASSSIVEKIRKGLANA
jgi:phosphate acyltransferase